MLATDPEAFDCDGCAVREALDGLNAENAEAWEMFHRLASRFLVDAQLISTAFQQLMVGRDAADVLDVLERLEVIYDIVQPPKTK